MSEFPTLTRRDFLKLGTIGAVALGAAAIKPLLDWIPDSDKGIFEILDVPDISELKNVWQKAVKESLEKKTLIAIRLPEGDLTIDDRIELELPKDAKVALIGSPTSTTGTRLRAGERLVDGVAQNQPDWAGSKNNLLKIIAQDGGGLIIKQIQFNGGSEKAGKGGYKAPLGPWNGVVRIIGAGPGDENMPVLSAAGDRKGLVIIDNCSFGQSESEGLLVQNVRMLKMTNCESQNVDGGVVAVWCDLVTVDSCSAENCLSDGFYISDCEHVEINGCKAEHCRQGIDIQGGGEINIKHFSAEDCAIAFRLAESETTRQEVQKLTLDSGDSNNCALIYSFGKIKDGKILNATHTNAGGWFKGYEENDFMHVGITNAGEIIKINAAVWGQKPDMENIRGTVSPFAPPNYNPKL